MKLSRSVSFLVLLSVASCAEPATTTEGSDTGSGGSQGSGGAAMAGGRGGDSTDTGGATGLGGVTASGGVTGLGGTTETGGATGSGGVTGLAGTTGTGGARGSGGVTGLGGTTGTGGVTGSGGVTGTGGAIGTGGAKGGTTGTGGTTTGTGGVTGVGGAPGTGGAKGGTTGTGGTEGLGAWTTGYAATMYGNDSSGDCAGYPDFGDTTSIDSQTCTTGQNKVSIASYSSGVNNNASYYGALGDLSTLWAGAECNCNGNDTCPSNQAPSCPAESQSGGDCGICVAVKCDPNGTFSLSGTTHDSDCSKTEYAVVQIIDACPHDHPTNVASSEGWCTSRQPNHIDLSCSALGGISTKGMNIGQDGWLNVDVQKVDCSIGLGLHSL
jgi:hypothetical protein